MADNWFDPPEPDPEAYPPRVRPVYIAPPLDPAERVRQGFQQTRIDDRRLMDAGSWLAQQPANPNFLTRRSVYQTPLDPTYDASYAPPIDPRDETRPLSLAAGVGDIENYTRLKNLEYAGRVADEMDKAEERRKQMEEYNKRLRKRREAGAR